MSRVLLRQFCDSSNNLSAMNLRYGNVKLIGPGGVCYLDDLNPDKPSEFELVWQSVEVHLPKMLEALRSRALFEDEALVQLARNCLSMHLSRSMTLSTMFDQLFPITMDRLEREMADDPRIDAAFSDRHSGLVPAGREGRTIAARQIRIQIEERFRSSGFLAERLVENYEKAKAWISDSPIEVGICTDGEFLLGDAPAQSLKENHPGVGPLGGVPLTEANLIVMPIGRHHCLSLGSANAYVNLPVDFVDLINRFQVVAAINEVVWHPDADNRSFVRDILAESKEA